MERIGNYILREVLARGGMGEVWVAVVAGNQSFEKKVVVKRMLASSPTAMEYFIAEAILCAKLDNEHIVRVFDFIQDPRTLQLYMVMEFIDGVTVEDLLVLGMVPVPMACLIVHHVCKALHHAHTIRIDGKVALIIHRDISPDNIILSSTGVAKLFDYGIATAKAEVLKRKRTENPAEIKGKFRYFPPEVLRVKELTPATDIYQLGLVFYEMLCAKPAYAVINQDTNAILSRIMLGEYTPIQQYNPTLPPKVIEIVHRMINVEPAERFQSAEEVQRELEAACPELFLAERPMRDLVRKMRSGKRTMTSPFIEDHEIEAAAARAREQAGKSGDASPPPAVSAPRAAADDRTVTPFAGTNRPQTGAPRASVASLETEPHDSDSPPSKSQPRWLVAAGFIAAVAVAGGGSFYFGTRTAAPQQPVVVATPAPAPSEPAPTKPQEPMPAPAPKAAEPEPVKVASPEPTPPAKKPVEENPAPAPTPQPPTTPPPTAAEKPKPKRPATAVAKSTSAYVVYPKGYIAYLDGIELGDVTGAYEVEPGKHSVGIKPRSNPGAPVETERLSIEPGQRHVVRPKAR